MNKGNVNISNKHSTTESIDSNLSKVSIIVPVYNVYNYLVESPDSIVKQSYTNLEIIIIDDGSNDGSSEICDEYEKLDSRIKLVHQDNIGLSGARNIGLDSMSGDYVLFVDSDDALHPDLVKTMLSVMLKEQVDCAICDYSVYKTVFSMDIGLLKQDSNHIKIPKGSYCRNDILSAIAEGHLPIVAWGKMYKSEIWVNNRFPVGHVYEDLFVVFDVFDTLDSVYIISEPLIMRRIRPNSIISTISLKNTMDYDLAQSRFENYIHAHINEVFSLEQLHNNQSNYLQYLFFRRIEISFSDNTEKEAIMGWIDKRLQGVQINRFIKKWKLKHRIAYYMYIINPTIFSYLYLMLKRYKKI